MIIQPKFAIYILQIGMSIFIHNINTIFRKQQIDTIKNIIININVSSI